MKYYINIIIYYYIKIYLIPLMFHLRKAQSDNKGNTLFQTIQFYVPHSELGHPKRR